MTAIADDRELLDAEVAAAGPEAVRVYKEILAKGETAKWAAMCALQAPPATKNTDQKFNASQRRRMNSMDPQNQAAILDIAKKAGINTQGKFYTGVGRYNDPMAWASTHQDVVDAAKRKKLKLEGGGVECDYLPHDAPPPPRKKLSEKIIAERATRMLKGDRRLREKMRKAPQKTRGELREQIIAKHSRH